MGGSIVLVRKLPRQLVQMFETRCVASPQSAFLYRRTRRILAGCADGVGDQAHRGDGHTVGNRQMTNYASRAANQAVAAHPRAAGNRGAAGYGGVGADHHVVGDLDEIVDLGPLPDDGGTERTTVDGGVGADLDIVMNDDIADLQHFAVAALMMQNGLKQEAMQVLIGLYQTIYLEKGLFFRTPEGWREDGNFVGSMYMRAGAVWSLFF